MEVHKEGNKFLMTNSFTDYLYKMWCSEERQKVDGWHFAKRMVKYDISGKADSRKETAELIVSNFPLERKDSGTRQKGMF
jgi:hypothetical protein